MCKTFALSLLQWVTITLSKSAVDVPLSRTSYTILDINFILLTYVLKTIDLIN